LDTRILLAIHEWSSPFLDNVFWFSDKIGALWFFTPVVILAAAWHERKGERAEAVLWIALGVSTILVQQCLKLLVARQRPALWPPIVGVTSLSFPSGHALASATFYPLLARIWARAQPDQAPLAYTAAVAMALFVGFGRLYLGVHWPTDVLAGWVLGAAQTVLAIRIRERGR
jgi:undecaprenyl-diphosphatase